MGVDREVREGHEAAHEGHEAAHVAHEVRDVRHHHHADHDGVRDVRDVRAFFANTNKLFCLTIYKVCMALLYMCVQVL